MPKYCIRDDGAVYPYSPALAQNSRFKVVDELPQKHLAEIDRSKARVDSHANAAIAMRQAHDARIAERKAATDAARARIAAGPAVDPAASTESQRQSDEFTGNAETAANDAPTGFSIADADKPALLEYLKQNFPAEKVHHNIGVEKLRLKVAELAGVQPE